MDREFVVVVEGVDGGDNREFCRDTWKNYVLNFVEELSTYPHCPWITRLPAEILGMHRRSLRRLSTEERSIPNSPTRRTRIIHIGGDLSTEKGDLSPACVESAVLRGGGGLVKSLRTYYAFPGRIEG